MAFFSASFVRCTRAGSVPVGSSRVTSGRSQSRVAGMGGNNAGGRREAKGPPPPPLQLWRAPFALFAKLLERYSASLESSVVF